MAKHPALTETAIAKVIKTAEATQQHARVPDPGMEGLWLSVGNTGTARWETNVRVAAEQGAPRRVGVGHYPGIGLAVGRTRCEAARVAARAGTALSGRYRVRL